jgi:MFS superfamily sulfate permease-like transporter
LLPKVALGAILIVTAIGMLEVASLGVSTRSIGSSSALPWA